MLYRLSSVALICLIAGALAVGCSSGSAPGTASDVAKPPSVPDNARLLRADFNVGAQNATPGSSQAADVFYSLRCEANLLTIATTEVALYAELPCDRSLPDDMVRRFLAQPVAVRVKVGQPTKLYLDSARAGSAEFTVGRVWLAGSAK